MTKNIFRILDYNMKIQSLNSFYSPNFKAATININAFSDTHGELLLANNAVEELRRRKKDVFEPQEKGKANITAICGDWFMDGARTGYLTNPTKKNGIFQLEIFNEFLNQIKGFAPNNTTLFTPGNHEFDGGVPLLAEIFEKINAEVLISNLETDTSFAFEESIKDGKLLSEKIIEVEDDKNPNLKHKVLFLGIIPVNLVSYQKNLTGVHLTDNVDKSQNKVEKKDYQDTLDLFKQKIDSFKSENPNGIVVLMSHTGVEFADNLARESTVDIVFDGHEHKDDVRFVNKTPIVPLSQNFKKIVNAKIEVNDNGKLDSITVKEFSPMENRLKGPLYMLYRQLFNRDLKRVYGIKTDNPEVLKLDTQNIRTGNNYLANFVTDSILSEIKKKDFSVDFLALNSSSIRRCLYTTEKANNSAFDVFNVLSGIKEEDGQIMTTKVSGRELAYMVVDNVVFNREAPNKNPLIQYSGLIIDKTGILEAIEKGATLNELIQYVVDERTGKPIKAENTYKIANVEKYFNKTNNTYIRKLKDKSEFFGASVQDMFKKHFIASGGVLHARCDTRVK